MSSSRGASDHVPSHPTYNFPYTPYGIQQDLMDHLYASISRGQVTVIESPTGTGKSLSLISSTLTYLADLKTNERNSLVQSIREQLSAEGEEEDWIVDGEIKRRLAAYDLEEKELEERLSLIREEEKKERRAKGRDAIRNKMRLGTRTDGGGDEEGDRKGKRRKIDLDDEFAPEPYGDEVEEVSQERGGDNFSAAVRELMKGSNPTTSHREMEEPDVRKIFFASRTHSQLSQFINEIRKTVFASAPPSPVLASLLTPAPTPPTSTSASTSASASIPQSHPIRVIPLGSRENLCINDSLRKKCGGNNEALGDGCLELQKASTKEKRCPFLPPLSEPGKLNVFRDRALASIHTIADIEDLGRKLGTCPYYGSRKAVQSAEVVTLPYNMLMQRSAREALGISLKDQIVVIDEAHNLIDTILNLHSTSINRLDLLTIQSALATYSTKFKSRLTGQNTNHLNQLGKVLKALVRVCDDFYEGGRKEELRGTGEVLMAGNAGGVAVDQINLLKLDEYLRESRIARKIGSYVDKVAEESTTAGKQAIRSRATKTLHSLQAFIVSLVNATADGRVLLTRSEGERNVSLKYMLLAPSEAFRDVVEEARSVILAGGTMKPISDFRTQLFPYLSEDRYSTFSCGHVVPKENIKTFAVSHGPAPKNLKMDFKSASRSNEMVDEFVAAIIKICFVVPKGLVIFVPSYAFLKQVQDQAGALLIKKLAAARKTLFWEPTEKNRVDPVLLEYKRIIKDTPGGAVLFAVVNAKLSEGINFEDDMARAVVICGIPYPNKHSTELSARMKYLDAIPKLSGAQKRGGDVLYDNLAFRGVNQSIGRAFRHATDWSSIILLDERYTHSAVQNHLPDWLGKDIETPATFGAFVAGLSGFCRVRRKKDEERKAETAAGVAVQ